MAEKTTNLNREVTEFVDELNHPFRKEIEQLRICILTAYTGLTENIKWNGPNYCLKNEDIITMRIQPTTTKQVQVIFHRGAKVQELPSKNLIADHKRVLIWKTTDRAIATYKSMQDIENGKTELTEIITEWINATK